MKENLPIIFIKYLVAEIELDRYYAKTGDLHPENCECDFCKDINKWKELNFLEKLIAKIKL